jgi:hypothetical protein
MTGIHDMFLTFSRCVLPIVVRDQAGDERCATCFHIGDGYMVTARHVVDGKRILSVGGWEPGLEPDRFYPAEENVDLAIVKTPIRLEPDRKVVHDGRYEEYASAVPLGSHLDDWLNDDAFITQKVLVMGYPPIPMTSKPVLVSVEAEVVAIVDKYSGPRHPYFVLSNIPRGGFSGGPVLIWGFLLGVATESLLEQGQPLEAGYSAALTVEPLLSLMGDRRVFPGGWNGDWARHLADFPEDLQGDWHERSDDYFPPALPWWFPWRVRAYHVASRLPPLRRLARRLAFHTRVGWRPRQ